jgi:hypothetical protein
MTADSEPRTWEHKRGDIYRVVIANAWMNEHAAGINYYPQPREHTSLASAIHDGFTEHLRGDDFNVGVWREGGLAAMLWMDEITDDDPAVLAQITAQWAGG